MYEDDVSLAAQEEEERVNFQNRFMEAVLSGELIDEIDLTDLFVDSLAEAREKTDEDLGEKGFAELVDGLISNQESVMTDFEIQDDVDAGLREWSAEYDTLINNPPKDGDILTASTVEANVLLTVELKEDNPPFIYGRAYVPEIVGHPLGWYLLDPDCQNFHGWKCILLPQARTELIRKFGLQHETMEVRSLKVIRQSQSGKSLLCEVHEYCKVEMAELEVEPEVEPEAKAQEPEVEVPEVKVPEAKAQEPEVKVLVNLEPKIRPSGHVERN